MSRASSSTRISRSKTNSRRDRQIDRLYGIKGAYQKTFKEVSDEPQISENMARLVRRQRSGQSYSQLASIPVIPSKGADE